MSTAPTLTVAGSLDGIYQALVKAGPSGITCDQAIAIATSCGAARYDSRIVGWRISRLRERLKSEGWTIRATAKGGTAGGRFILELITAAVPVVEVMRSPSEILGIYPVQRKSYASSTTSTSAGVPVSLARVSFIDGARP